MGLEYQRKKLNLSVKNEFQRWLLFRIFGTVILSSLVAGGILYLFARKEVVDSFYTAHVTIRRVSDLLLPVVLAGSFVSLLSGTLLALFLPQKIAGPLFRIEEELEAVRKGDLTVKIKLRNDDTMKDFVAIINQTIASLRIKVERIQKVYNCIERCKPKNDQEEKARAMAREELRSIKT